MLGLVDVKEASSGALNAADKFERGACESLSHLEGTLESLNGGEGEGAGAQWHFQTQPHLSPFPSCLTLHGSQARVQSMTEHPQTP